METYTTAYADPGNMVTYATEELVISDFSFSDVTVEQVLDYRFDAKGNAIVRFRSMSGKPVVADMANVFVHRIH